MGELGSMLGMANAAQAGAAAGTAGSAMGSTAAGMTQRAAGTGEMFGALSGNTAATVAGGAAKTAQGASMLSGAGDALMGAGSQVGQAVAEKSADVGMLGQMKNFGDEVLTGLGKGLFTNDKVYTPGAGGKGIDWTATLSKAAGRIGQRKIDRALGGGADGRWKRELAQDMWNSRER